MNKKLLFPVILLTAFALPHGLLAYSFSAVAPTGQTLYYNITDDGVSVTCPTRRFDWSSYSQPTGALTIPSTVTHSGTTYSVTSIGDAAFTGCSGLTFITIPSSVSSIGGSAFHGCTSLTSVNIPDSVSSIGGSAFHGCTSLTSVNIPTSVTSIGYYAFSGCTSLTSVNIPTSVTSIGNGAFCYTGLTSVNIPNSVTSIGEHAFEKVRHIEYYGTATGSPWGAISKNGVTDGDFVFLDNSRTYLCAYIGNGGSVSIPSTVTHIGNYAFYGYTSLTSVNIPTSVTSIGYCAFENCTSLTSVTIPNSISSIASNSFYGCTSLTSVNIPNSISSIASYSFYGCTSLTSVNIPTSVTSIGFGAFENCTSLTSVNIPDSVTSIGYSAFYGCTSLTSVNIPTSVTSIGNGAFCYTGLTSVNIPSSVTSISENPFLGCRRLTSITVDNANTVYDSRGNCNAIVETSNNSLITGCQNTVIPNSVTSIGYEAFSECTSLTSVTIPNSVTSIGYCAFKNCTSLTSVTIPNSISSIASNSFYGCTSLTFVNIPTSVTSIGNGAFGSCTSLTSITVDNANTVYDSRGNCNAIIETSNNSLIAGCQNTVIPNNVTSIGRNAFNGCTGLTSVNIPSSVTSIGEYAFGGCTGLTSVTIPPSVTSIGENAFGGCTGLTSVTIPNSVTSIDRFTYYGCTNLISVTIPNSVTIIPEGAFSGCSSLDTITVLNDNPPTIWGRAFDSVPYTCTIIVPCSAGPQYRSSSWDRWFYNITESCDTYYDFSAVSTSGNILYYIILDSNRVAVVHPAADTTALAYWDNFAQPSGTLTIPDTVTYNDTTYTVVRVSEYAFYDCNAITSTTIPNTVDSIGSNAFAGCTGLTSITARRQVAPTVGTNAFADIADTISVYIPCGSTASYASRWRHFSNFIEVMDFQVHVASNDAAMGTVSVVSEPSCATPVATIVSTPNAGYHFVQWNDGNADNPRNIELTSDTMLVALFAPDSTEGIGDVEAAAPNITCRNGQIVVEGAEGCEVVLYDVMGRQLATRKADGSPLHLDTHAVGIYLVKVGSRPVAKVVLMQ